MTSQTQNHVRRPGVTAMIAGAVALGVAVVIAFLSLISGYPLLFAGLVAVIGVVSLVYGFGARLLSAVEAR